MGWTARGRTNRSRPRWGGVALTVLAVVTAGPAQAQESASDCRAAPEGIRPGARIEQALLDATSQGITDSHQLQQVVRRTIGPWVGRKIRRRPMIIPTVIEA